MVSATPGGQSRKTTARRLRSAVAVLVALFAIAALATCVVIVHMAKAALPQVDGTISLAGLNASVSVVRDHLGVPHIRAGSAHDLFFAQGYVTAQDRLWQMDMSRRYSAGELSEVLGAGYIATDKRQRILRLHSAAEAAVAALSARNREHLKAYADGVNAYIEHHKNSLPLEFRVLRYSPRAWTPTDSLLCGILMAEMLNGNEWETKLAREAVAAKLTPDLMQDLYPATSWRDHPPGAANANLDESSPAQPQRAAASGIDTPSAELSRAFSPLFDEFGPDDIPAAGSNNWAVSGAHTATGKPLLSNDMHLAHRIPNVWYEAHLTIASTDASQPSFDVAGFTIPGFPYVVVGHNQRIAWGFTNIMPDVQDVYVESLNDKNEYLTPSGWQPLDVRREVIRVKGKPDVELTTRATRHGPIVSELVEGEKRTLALRWTLYEQPTTTTFFEVDSAQNWNDFLRAFSKFTGPGQNVVYADVDGHIGYHATGRVPLRRTESLVPVSGADNAHEWTGYIPFDAMPSVFDPPGGIIATANSRISPEGAPYTISTSWDGPPYRTQRIYRLLSSGQKLTPADMLNIQMDVYSSFDVFCAQHFASAIDRSKNASTQARAAADVLRRWDGRVTPESASPTILAFARRQLWRMLLEPHLGHAAGGAPGSFQLAGWTAYRWPYSSVALENILERQPARWLPAQFQSFDDLLTAAMSAAISEAHGSERQFTQKRWRWGVRFPLTLQHPIFGAVPILNHWSGPGTVPQAGDSFTIKAAGPEFGPSERMTVDFADLDQSTLNIVTGESGNLFSPNYMDQWAAWYHGTTFAFPFSPSAVTGAAVHRLTLAP